ncbi:hypothetical protein [Sedimenticola thiotaurini]|uniref:Uncharacterized protein n=1 Tax=Sedimenticola thiotaurini TaxID=1543721 RepID=A0A0F7K4C0_9GAMM|nr:hypothetical protein [Sedimenticola thiotaurini]AKH22404.1 hypothetical protein AAY24_18260 [Sedimenticola thiotaurini]
MKNIALPIIMLCTTVAMTGCGENDTQVNQITIEAKPEPAQEKEKQPRRRSGVVVGNETQYDPGNLSGRR